MSASSSAGYDWCQHRTTAEANSLTVSTIDAASVAVVHKIIERWRDKSEITKTFHHDSKLLRSDIVSSDYSLLALWDAQVPAITENVNQLNYLQGRGVKAAEDTSC